jgi:hypothetical protein
VIGRSSNRNVLPKSDRGTYAASGAVLPHAVMNKRSPDKRSDIRGVRNPRTARRCAYAGY